jgi:hypothetical protein
MNTNINNKPHVQHLENAQETLSNDDVYTPLAIAMHNLKPRDAGAGTVYYDRDEISSTVSSGYGDVDKVIRLVREMRDNKLRIPFYYVAILAKNANAGEPFASLANRHLKSLLKPAIIGELLAQAGLNVTAQIRANRSSFGEIYYIYTCNESSIEVHTCITAYVTAWVGSLLTEAGIKRLSELDIG